MKYLIIILAGTFLTTSQSFGQTISEIFRLLPLELTQDLDDQKKDSLLLLEPYTIPRGSTEETVIYDVNSHSEDYLEISYYFTTGQQGFMSHKLMRVELAGKNAVIYSKCSGTYSVFHQQEFIIFELFDNGLVQIADSLTPQKINHKKFLKSNTPDPMVASFGEDLGINGCFQLLIEEQEITIEYRIIEQLHSVSPWLEYNTLRLTWRDNQWIEHYLNQ